MKQKRNLYKDVLFGVAIGDALGVPVEFKSRESISVNPVTDMIGFGTYNQLEGTFSDDSSLTFCLAEALIQGYNLKTIGRNFVKWYHNNFWTATGKVFDIGFTTLEAINKLSINVNPEEAGRKDEDSNGNGSLMRILPLVFEIKDKPIAERFELTKQVSSITHGHIRSVIACFYYLEFAKQLIEGKNKFEIYDNLKKELPNFLLNIGISNDEIVEFNRLFKRNINECIDFDIWSTGYVLHTLEASIWCLLNSVNYKDAVLKAVNLGGDTDTTAAVTGGLAGLLYGKDTMPKPWVRKLARTKDIDDLAIRLEAYYEGKGIAKSNHSVPFDSAYWVIEGKLIAGEIPISFEKTETTKKLNGLVNLDVGAVINLMEEDEKDYFGELFYDYSTYLEDKGVKVHRHAIKDMDIPSPIQMMRILKQIEYYTNQNKIVYVHCWGGIGRTGTVVGCYLLQNKLANSSNVLSKIIELKKDSGLALKESPQTQAQREFILDWV
jgi:ADP-ribosyl-[dinitrogen reductase] hydrolase